MTGHGKDLFAIGEDLVALESLLHEVGGDVTDEEAAAAIDEWLRENHQALDRKLDGYGYLVKKLTSESTFAEEESRRLAARAKARKNAATRMKERLKIFMEIHGQKKLSTDRYDFAIQADGGKAPLEVLIEPEKLPKWAQRVTVSADTDAIRQKLESGYAPAMKIARLGGRGTHLRIR
jgi:hypothetical protein